MTSIRRLIPLALAILLAGATAVVALAHSGGTEAATRTAHHHAAAVHDHAAISANELAP